MGTQVVVDSKEKGNNQSMRLESRRRAWPIMELVLCALWGVCFVRAFHFYRETQATFVLYRNGDANADFLFSQQILFCYGVSFVIGSVLVWCACYRGHLFLWLLAGGVYLTAAFIVFCSPEEVIVLSPNLPPDLALIGSVLLALVAGIEEAVAALKRRLGDRAARRRRAES